MEGIFFRVGRSYKPRSEIDRTFKGPETEMKNVFVSYSHRDRVIADRMARSLSGLGVDVWIDQWEIRPGDSLIEKINEGLNDKDILLLLLSSASVASSWVQKELSSALMEELARRKVVVVPVLIETCELPPLIADKKYTDFRVDYEAGLRELMSALPRPSPVEKIQLALDSAVGTWRARRVLPDKKLLHEVDEYASQLSLRTDHYEIILRVAYETNSSIWKSVV